MLIYIYAYKHPQTKDRKVNPFRSPRLSLRSGELQQGAHVGGWSRSWRAPGAAKCRGYQGINTCIYYYYTIIILYYIILYYIIWVYIYIYIHIVGIFFFSEHVGNIFWKYVWDICFGNMLGLSWGYDWYWQYLINWEYECWILGDANIDSNQLGYQNVGNISTVLWECYQLGIQHDSTKRDDMEGRYMEISPWNLELFNDLDRPKKPTWHLGSWLHGCSGNVHLSWETN